MIDQLKKNAKFQTLVQEIQQKPENNQLDLASYLIMPVQRKSEEYTNSIASSSSDSIPHPLQNRTYPNLFH